MNRWIALTMVAAVVALAMTGCVNVKVPDGPYVNLSDDASSDHADHDEPDLKDFEDLLEKARKDGVITKSQYKELRHRLEKAG